MLRKQNCGGLRRKYRPPCSLLKHLNLLVANIAMKFAFTKSLAKLSARLDCRDTEIVKVALKELRLLRRRDRQIRTQKAGRYDALASN